MQGAVDLFATVGLLGIGAAIIDLVMALVGLILLGLAALVTWLLEPAAPGELAGDDEDDPP